MKYQKGDKVVIRKDLKVDKKYGNITWLEGMEPMKSMLFTTILGVGDKGSYVLDTGWCVSEEMISHKQEEEEVAEFNMEVKYRAGDKVVLRKDLEINTMYDGSSWVENMTELAELPYVEIVEVDSHNLGKGTIYYIEGSEYVISNDMISHVYTEQGQRVEQTMKYQVGDKIVLRKDLVSGQSYGLCFWTSWMDYLVDRDYLTISEVNGKSYKVKGATIHNITDEMISHKYEEEGGEEGRHVWVCKDEINTHILWHDGSILTHPNDSVQGSSLQGILSPYLKENYLLTEEEARKSAFYSILQPTDLHKEKLFYIFIVGSSKTHCLNYDIVNDSYFMSTPKEGEETRTKFTEEEADKIIGTSTVLYKEEVG